MKKLMMKVLLAICCIMFFVSTVYANNSQKEYAEVFVAYSAGAILALACNEIIVHDFSCMMLHSASSRFGGKVSEMSAYSKHLKKLNELVVKEVSTGFLTDGEINSVLKGDDIWLIGGEIEKRLENRVKYRNKLKEIK